MRYYDLTLTKPGQSIPTQHWSSQPGGKYDPGALNITFDILAYNYASPLGASSIKVEGISLSDLTQATQYGPQISADGTVTSGMTLQLKGGMQAGLPLVNPSQAGILTIGSVYQSFGNWQGTDMELDFVILASPYTYQSPGNIVLNWQAGEPLSQALKSCLSVAYPAIPIKINISQDLILGHDEVGHYHTLSQLAQAIKSITTGLLSSTYKGVEITFRRGQLVAYDDSIVIEPTPLVFTDLIGQPTWLEPYIIQIKTVLRADLQVGSVITMPKGLENVPGIVTTQQQSMPSYLKYTSIFKGQFQVISMRHVGEFRSTDASGWVTILNCTPYYG